MEQKRKRDLRRKKELGVKLQGAVVDELDRMVAETDTGTLPFNEPMRSSTNTSGATATSGGGGG